MATGYRVNIIQDSIFWKNTGVNLIFTSIWSMNPYSEETELENINIRIPDSLTNVSIDKIDTRVWIS